MGAYMAKPCTEKQSLSGSTEWITYGVSSMQGWRMQQEDSHNCEPEFDPSRLASLFAVYDGHGGSEVARYCAAYLPGFLKGLPTYATDDPVDVLKRLFIDFDAALVTPEVRSILHSLAEKDDKQSDDVVDQSDDSDEEESDSEISALREEANEPLESVLERYGGEDALPTNIKDLLARRKNKVGECSTASGKTTKDSNEQDGSPSTSKEGNSDDNNDNSIKVVENSPGKSESSILSMQPSSSSKSSSKSLEDTNGDGVAEEEDDSDDEDVDPNEEVDEDADTSEESEDTDEEEEEDDDDDDEDAAIEGLRLGVPSALRDQDDSEPGMDSGTTACVALILPCNGVVKLFVANAGDSRAVLCRDGAAVDLSVDHKPEDEDEKSRIVAAGGTVTRDGRVNGGLNLSRALGDHSYKQVKGLPLTDQMITPSPDVTQFNLTPGSDEFLVLACDGVWNSMTSQEVVDFVRDRLEPNLTAKGDEPRENPTDLKLEAAKLSKICEEIFDRCLAPNTDGDGTGCDNMTCIIVRFNNLEGLAKRSLELSTSNATGVRKRAAVDEKGISSEADASVVVSDAVTSPKRIRSDDIPVENAKASATVTNGDCA